jgi:2-methylisocitrate lyase-like PEP mutase family enzyme
MTGPGPTQIEKANDLWSLHTNGRLLILPNVWNPIGARVLQAKGFPAVATASAAISASLGYKDGEMIRRATLIDIVGRVARSVDVPVTADIEAGYGPTISDLQDTIRFVIVSGIVGVNLEDSLTEGGALRSVEDQCDRISAVREIANRDGMHLVINARTDSYLSSTFENVGEATEDVVMRAAAYANAGADCIYPIGPGDENTVRELRRRIASPINILAGPSAAPLSVLASLGVNRVSFGPYVFRTCLKKFSDIADALKMKASYECISDSFSTESTAAFLKEGRE